MFENISTADSKCSNSRYCSSRATLAINNLIISEEYSNCCWNVIYCACLISQAQLHNCTPEICRPLCFGKIPSLEKCLTSSENDTLSLYASFIIGLVMIFVYVVAVFTSFSKTTSAKFKGLWCCNVNSPQNEKTIQEAITKAELTQQQANFKNVNPEKRSRSKLVAKMAESRQQPTMYQLAKSKASFSGSNK